MEALRKALREAPALRFCLLSLAAAIALLRLGWSWERALTAALLCSLALCGAVLLILRRRELAYLCSVGAVALWWSMHWRETLPVRIPHRLEPTPALLAGQIRQVLRDEPPVFRALVEGELDAQALPPVRTRVLLHVFGTDGTEPWRTPGEFLRAQVRVRPPTPAQLPTDFPEWEYCAHLGAQWVATAHREGVALWVRESSWSALLSRWIAQQRQQILHAIAQLYPEWLAGVMAALLCGDRSKLQPEERRAFALAGVAHVLAVSGLHVGILAAAISIALGFVPWQGVRWGIFCIALAAFVLLTGAQPSAVRAGITAALAWGIALLQRPVMLPNLVAAVALMTLLLEPAQAFSSSFQLSTAAMLGIALLYELLRQRLQELLPWVPAAAVQLSAVSLAASTVSAPLVALHFQMFSLLAVPLNLIVVPLCSLGMLAGILSLLAYPLSSTIAGLYASAAQACMLPAIACVHTAAQLPIAAVEGWSSVPLAIGAQWGLLWLLWAPNPRVLLPRALTVAVLTLLGVLALRPHPSPMLLLREHILLRQLPLDTGTLLALLDRRPHGKPRPDRALERYAQQLPGRLWILYAGNHSEYAAVRIARSHPRCTVVQLPESFLRGFFAPLGHLSRARTAPIEGHGEGAPGKTAPPHPRQAQSEQE